VAFDEGNPVPTALDEAGIDGLSPRSRRPRGGRWPPGSG
jgi:hypothetical protein